MRQRSASHCQGLGETTTGNVFSCHATDYSKNCSFKIAASCRNIYIIAKTFTLRYLAAKTFTKLSGRTLLHPLSVNIGRRPAQATIKANIPINLIEAMICIQLPRPRRNQHNEKFFFICAFPTKCRDKPQSSARPHNAKSKT